MDFEKISPSELEKILLSPPKIARGKNLKPAAYAESLVAVGDIHGEAEGFIHVMSHAGIIDKAMHWSGDGKTLIQIGDVIDRGAYSMQANSLLARLQKEAKSYGGKVVRIAGNHEIELLRGDFFMTTLSREEAVKYRLQIVRDILDGNITAAYAEQGYLFTHAGVTSKLMEILADEFRIKTPDEENTAKAINGIFAAAVLSGDYLHPIFNIGLSRGGPHEFGGIFWEDLRELLAFPGPDTIKQVVGHTPLPSITKFHSGKITGIDVGLFEGYGGNRAYLKIENKVPSFIELRVSSPYDAQAQFTPRKG